MKPRALVPFIALTLFATLGSTVQTPAHITQDQITIFDAPGANGGTFPITINSSGEITGSEPASFPIGTNRATYAPDSQSHGIGYS